MTPSEREIMTWDDLGEGARTLAQAVADDGYLPDIVLGIARGGLLVAGALGYALGVKNTFTMNVEFYTGVDERLEMPMILPPVPDLVDFAETRVLVADDVADTGATLKLVQEFCAGKVAEVRCAVLYEKPRSIVRCEYVWRRTDRWIVFPWSADEPVLTAPPAPPRPLHRPPPVPPRARPYPPGRRRRPGLDTGRRVGYRRPRPPAHRHIRFEERSTLTRRKLALAAAAFVIAGAAAVLALGTSPGRAKSNAAFKVAWIYVGPHNDGGWSQAHDEGRQYVQKMLGSKVQTTYKENIAVGAQLQQTVASLVSQGYKMIFGTSYGFFDKALAAKYPNVLFEQATGTDVAKNLAEYFGRAEDTVFLSGMAAGAAAKCNTIGYVVAYPIPEVIRHANAFALGAQVMHPGVKVRLVWTNSWFDPAKEKKAAESLHAAGACVLGQNVDSPATGQYAESQGIPWVGYDSDAEKFAPKSWLTASVYNWGPYYLRRVKAAMDGTWKSGFYYC